MYLKNRRIPSVLLLIVGIIFIVAGVLVVIQSNGLKQRCTEETTGTVVEVISERDHTSTDLSYTFYPVIEYRVGDRTITQKSTSGQYPPKYSVGQQVKIYYNPNNVEEFIIQEDSIPNVIGIVFIVIGSVAAIAAIYMFIRNARKAKESKTPQ